MINNIRKIENLGARMNLCPYVSFIDEVGFEFNYGKYYDNWIMPECYISEPKPGKNTMMRIGSGHFVFSPKMVDGLYDTIDGYGQFLPIDIEGIGRAYILNVTVNNEDAIDMDETIFSDGEVSKKGREWNKEDFNNASMDSRYLAFKKELIKYPIFNVRYIRGNMKYNWGPYATSGFFKEEKEFLSIFRRLDIKGMATLEMPVV